MCLSHTLSQNTCFGPIDYQDPTRLHHLILLIPAISATMHGAWTPLCSFSRWDGRRRLPGRGGGPDAGTPPPFSFLFIELSLHLLHIPEAGVLPGSEERHSWDLCRVQDAPPVRTEGWRSNDGGSFTLFKLFSLHSQSWRLRSEVLMVFCCSANWPEGTCGDNRNILYEICG